MKRLAAFLLALALFSLAVSVVRADDSDIVLANISPNVMILVDSSGSMDWYIPAGGYTATYSTSTTYPGTFTSTRVYDLSGNSYARYISSVPSSAAQTALNLYGRYDGLVQGSLKHLRMGNYLNYMRSELGAKKKMDIAKSVLTSLINGTDGVRFGIAEFRNNDANFGSTGGASIVAQIATRTTQAEKDALTAAIMAMQAVGSTPSGAALADLGKYFAGTLSNPAGGTYPSPVDSTQPCVPNYIILMSDGQPNDGSYSWAPFNNNTPDPNDGHGNATGNPTVSPWVATLLKNQTPKVLVDTIGFAVGSEEATVTNATLLSIATNSGGQFFSAADEPTLEADLEAAVHHILQATFCFAAPVFPTTSATGSARAYFASFESDPSNSFWKGHLKAYQRVNGVVPIDATTKLPTNSAVWDAAEKLVSMSADDRTIYTYLGGSLVTFDSSHVTYSDLGGSASGVPDATAAGRVIDFVRGVSRDYKLGDIFHSTPVIVTPPYLPSNDATYTAFKSAQASRPTIVIAGANDGMLHAFKETNGVTPTDDGKELWAYIPSNLLPNLVKLTDPVHDHQHYFFVDSSPIAADVKIGPLLATPDTAHPWRTIVIFGQRRGGNTYTALDITNTASPSYMWSFTDDEIGETWSQPVIGKVKMDPSAMPTNWPTGWPAERYVAFIGGGPGNSLTQDNTKGRGVFAIDIATGTKIWEYKTTRTASHTPTCSTSIDDRECMNYSIPSDVLAIDLNSDGYTDHVYVADIAGQLWKFVTKNAATLSSGTSGTISTSVPTTTLPGKCDAGTWCAKRLFAAPNSNSNPPWTSTPRQMYPAQPVYYAPTAALDNKQPPTLWLYFGTGDRNNPNATAYNRIYGIKDTTPDDATNHQVLRETDSDGNSLLADVTSTNTDADALNGWLVRLLNTNEKILAQALVFNSIVYANSFVPNSSSACNLAGGTARQYAVQMSTGYAAIANWATGTPYSASNPTNASKTRSMELGQGIASRPTVIVTESGTITSTVVQGTTNQQLPQNPAPSPTGLRRVLYWREVF